MAVSHVTDRVGQVLGGRYRLLAPVGTGASASVYLADDATLRRKVAIKVLHAALADDEAFLRRFRAEAQAAAGLNHPNVVVVYDWGEDLEIPFLVTEYLGGGSLRAMLDLGRRLTPAQALLVGLETARGLEYAHRRGFVHRDIKPANLLFDQEARLRIADFGLARALAEAAWTEPMGAVLGTARYASPEQARGERLDGKSDVYSLALLMIESVTGEVPFSADTTLGTLMARVGQPLVVPEEMDALQLVLQAVGVPDPAERPDAAAFGMALLGIASSFDRPGPLPLAGARARDLATDDDPDRTEQAGVGISSAAGNVAGKVAGNGASVDDDITIIAAGQPTVGDHAGVGGVTFANDLDDAGEAGDITVAVPIDDVTQLSPVVDLIDGDDVGSTVALPRGRRRDARRVAKVEKRDEWARARAEREAERTRRRYRRRRRWPYVVVAIVLVLAGLGAGGAYWWAGQRVPTHAMVGLVGRDLAEAEELSRANGWNLQRLPDQHADGTRPGQILSQNPLPSTEVQSGTAVHIVVSLGPPPVAVPLNLAGQTLDTANAALVQVGLGVGGTTREFSETVPFDGVIKLADGTPSQLPKGSTVDLVLSAGPLPRTIPDGLIGKPVSEATATLEELGLKVAPIEEFSNAITKGNVISVKPGVREQVERGATVQLVVSKGPETIAVPDVEGMTVNEAADAIEAVGLVVSDTKGSPRRRVVITDPAAGTQVRKGTKITLITSSDDD